MLTRSGRISYNNLSQRDPNFTEAVTRWFTDQTVEAEAGKSKMVTSPRIIAPPPMFTPLRLRNMTLTNRVVLTPVSTSSAQDGLPNSPHQTQLLTRAQGGVGLVITEPAAVSAEGRITPGDVGLYNPEHVTAWTKIVEQVHSQSEAKIALQLNHAGRRGSTRPRATGLDRPLKSDNWPLLAASALPYTPVSQTPKMMDQRDMQVVCETFTQATKFANEVGFDMLHLNMAHGYLLATFLSPLTNQRDDKYGGSLKNRARFPLEVFAAVRKVWPKEKPLSVALTATDWEKDGAEIEDAVAIAEMLKGQGCDLIEVLAGQTTAATKPVYGSYFLAPYSEQIRNEVGLKMMIGGGITITDQVNSLLAGGRTDLCIMNPSHLVD